MVPGDRNDVVVAACLAAVNGTRLAALLLTAGTEPDPRVWELSRAACATGLPILVVDDDSYETATRVRDLDPGLPIDDLERIEGVVDSIADALDASWLESLRSSSRSRRLSPAAFRFQLVEHWPGVPPPSETVPGPDTRPQAVLGVVRDRGDLVQIGERGGDQDRPEDLLADDLHLRAGIGQHGGLDEVAAVPEPPAAG